MRAPVLRRFEAGQLFSVCHIPVLWTAKSNPRPALALPMGEPRLSNNPVFGWHQARGWNIYGAEWGKNGENQQKDEAFPAPFCQLFQIHGSVLKPDPPCNGGQTSVVRVSHGVFFLGIRKYTFDGLLS